MHKRRLKPSDFGETPDTYGKANLLDIRGDVNNVIPLVHPRQAGKLGRASAKWTALHQDWVSKRNTQFKNGIRKLFSEKPEQWGFRGDHYLWMDMEEYMSSANPPQNADEFTELFFQTFEKLVGDKLVAGKDYTVDKYSHRGMSNGMINGEFWLNTVLLMLKGRFLSKHKTN